MNFANNIVDVHNSETKITDKPLSANYGLWFGLGGNKNNRILFNLIKQQTGFINL
jgi:hypothetical protein